MLLLTAISFIVVLDQATKVMVTQCFSYGERLCVVPGLFSLSYVRNTGAAWGVFHDLNSFLAVFSIVVLLGLIVFGRSMGRNDPRLRFALSLIAAGIIGNVLDRLRLGFVVDFLDFYYKGHHFPSFNVADSAICLGVALYLVSSYLWTSNPFTGGRTIESEQDVV
jgi:signal peptidase II